MSNKHSTKEHSKGAKEEELKRTSAIGSHKEAAITGMKGEREVINERDGTRRRLAVDSRVRELQTIDLYR